MAASLAPVYRGLAQLHEAGLAWPEALDAAAPRDHERFAAAREALARGRPVAEAFATAVPPLHVAVIRAGEASGRLGAAFASLATRVEDQERRDRERRAATAYPWLVAHVAALLLPIPDLVAGRTGRALLWALAVLVPLHGVAALARAARHAAERDPAAARRFPTSLLLGRAWTEEADARALSALGALHDAGVPLLEALPLASRAGAGGRVAGDLDAAAADVRAGRALSTRLAATPPDVAAALRVGEAAGVLGDACERAARSLEELAAFRRKRFAAAAPVAVTLALGALVAARVISFYAGLYRIAG